MGRAENESSILPVFGHRIKTSHECVPLRPGVLFWVLTIPSQELSWTDLPKVSECAWFAYGATCVAKGCDRRRWASMWFEGLAAEHQPDLLIDIRTLLVAAAAVSSAQGQGPMLCKSSLRRAQACLHEAFGFLAQLL